MKRDSRLNGEAAPDEQVAENSDEQATDTEDMSENGEAVNMQDELAAERQRSAEYLDQAQRARAELVNYRRRTEEELVRMQRQAGERIISKLLPAVDDLNRAIESLSDEDRETSWAEGIALIQRKLWSILESEGVSPIESLGKPFDPSLHEAISIQDGAEGASTVVQEYQRGYMLGDRVLRPAMVVVGSPEEAPGNEDDESQQPDMHEEQS
jgi:molecular chaperone GrpE